MSTLQSRLSFRVKKHNTTIPVSKQNKNEKFYTHDYIQIIDSSSDTENTPIKTPRKTKNAPLIEQSVTPPKQKRYSNSSDVENQCFPKTPSTLLAKLDLAASENCERENTENEKQSRRKLFDSDNIRYENARRALHSAIPIKMPARAEELENLKNFIHEHLRDKTSGTLYISGPPGTGKTAALTKTLSELTESKYKDVYINCTSIKSAQAVYSKIAKELNLQTTGRTEKAYLVTIEKYLTTKHQPIILVLDEIDQLDSRKQSVLYTIFEWPSRLNSRLILIGIANALDLTDRILPRLQAHCELKPRLMHFAPYTKQQIIEILIDRLQTADVLEVFTPVAIQMLAGKVAAVSGDVRRALDIARRVIETITTDQQQPIDERILNEITSNHCTSPPLKSDAAKSVSVNQVVTVLSSVYGASQNLKDDVDETIPLQQKLILCTLLLMLKKGKGKNKDVTVGKLNEVYRKVCKKRNVTAIDQSEFVGLCSLLETRGIVSIHGRKESRLNRVCLQWDDDEVSMALKDKQLLSSVLEDESVLGR